MTQVLEAPPGCAGGGGAAQHDVAEPDAVGVPGGEIAQVVPVAALPGLPVSFRSQSAITQPRLGVLGRVGHLPLDHPDIYPAASRPGLDAFTPACPGGDLPVAQELRHTTRGQV